jgi:thiol-activated cytolysin
MALVIGVNVSTLTSDVRARLSFRSDRQYNRFLVVFNQRYYTMSYDLPTSLDELFAHGVSPADRMPYVGPYI